MTAHVAGPVLITAGATRNPVDAIRVLTANASGQTGVRLGERLRDAGAQATVLGSPEACLRAERAGLSSVVYGSTRDLMAKMEAWVRAHPSGAVLHSAAVGDYEVADPTGHKLPSGEAELVIRLGPAPKIADRVRGWGLVGAFVTFKAASPGTSAQALCDIARAQRTRTGSDWVFANVLGDLERDVWIVGEQDERFAARRDAIEALAQRVLGR
jgi:phosphopantothenoylcysteine synthetase/decarboxylase